MAVPRCGDCPRDAQVIFTFEGEPLEGFCGMHTRKYCKGLRVVSPGAEFLVSVADSIERLLDEQPTCRLIVKFANESVEVMQYPGSEQEQPLPDKR
jgi:hypothetical protein